MTKAGQEHHWLVGCLNVKVNSDGQTARSAMRQALAMRLPREDVQLNPLGIAPVVAELIQKYHAQHIPDEWVDALSAAGTPQQAADAIERLSDAGADSVVFQPLNGDPDCLDEYIRFLMPLLKSG